MKGPETQYKGHINKLIKASPCAIHIEGMANPFRRGTPDYYYEGAFHPLWVEYKFLKLIPKVLDLVGKEILSPFQKTWLLRANKNGVYVAVIVGSPEGGLILSSNKWEAKFSKSWVLKHIKTKQQVADWIINVTTGGHAL